MQRLGTTLDRRLGRDDLIQRQVTVVGRWIIGRPRRGDEAEIKKKKKRREHRETAAEKGARYYAVPRTRIRYLLQDAKRRAIRLGMSFDDRLFELLNNPPTHCACCSVELKYDRRDVPRYRKEWRSPSIDRINNDVGYELSNVAMTCWGCNYAKRDMSLEKLKMLVAYVERELKARRE